MITNIFTVIECVMVVLICLFAILAAVFKILSIYENKKNADKMFVIIKKNGKVIERKYMTIDEYNTKLSEIAFYTGFNNYEMISFDYYEVKLKK